MTPLLTLWLSDRPSGLKGSIAAAMSAEPYHSFYKPMDVPLGNPAELRMLLSATYRDLIGPDAYDTVLHVALIVPLWEEGIAAKTKETAEALAGISNRSSLEIIGLQSALAELDGSPLSEDMAGIQKGNIDAISGLCAEAPFHCCLCVVDNYIATGASAKFDISLFSKFLCTFLKTMIDVYADIFNSLLTGGEKMVVAPGLSCLEFRRDKMVDYLLHRSFIAALDDAGIMQENVDAQGAAERAYSLLKGFDRFYSDFYAAHVEPLVNSKLPEGEIAAQIKAPLDQAVEEAGSRLTSFMDDPSLSLPDKEATWAIILGRDNARLAGTLYKQKELSFDDVYTEPSELFIDTFNKLAPGTGKLPERGNYPDLAYEEDNPENQKAFNPLPRINSLKSELLDITSYLRIKEKELGILKAKADIAPIVSGHLSDEGFVFGGEVRHLEHDVVEQPLNEIYTPPAGLKIRESVDLRKFFSPIRDQGDLGSCSSFSIIAIYESILNRLENAPVAKAALSERFLFYHTNVLTGRIDGGSNFFEQLEAFGKYGSCTERAYPYTTKGLLEKPSEAAVEEAFRHRVLMARQIPLKSGGNKYENISANHTLITSALTEGYPVGLSLRIFDDFGSGAAGHVGRPTDEQIASEGRGNHAMVIVGYSERDKCYIVRNSWGESFGDKGYCYISASYIDDPDLNNFCCIITDTTDGPAIGADGPKVPGLVAAFGGTETEIKIASISNAVDEARIHYTSLNAVYEQLYAYYSDLQERLSQPFIRNDLREMAEHDSSRRLAELELHKKSLIDAFPKTLKEYCHAYIIRCIKTGLTTLGLALVVGLLNYVGINNEYTNAGWIITTLLLIETIGMAIHYKWAKRRKRMELQEEVDGFAVQAARERKRLMEMQLHFHVGGLVLDAMHMLQLQLDTDYNRLVSFNNNLTHWHKEDSEKIAKLDTASEAMFVNLTRANLLDTFFEKNRKEIVRHISLLNAFGTYELTPDGMQKVRDSLSEETSAAIAKLFEDFSMIDYLQERKKYEYLPPLELDSTLKLLNRMSNVLTRHNDESITFESKFSLIDVPQDRMASWRALCQPHFSFIPMALACSNKDILLLLTMKKLDVESLIL